MKIHSLSLFRLFFVLHMVPVHAYGITCATIQEDAIQKKVEKIKAEFALNSMQKKVIYGALAAGGAYCTYQFFFGGQPTPPPVKTDVPVPVSVPAVVEMPETEPGKVELTRAGIAYLNKMALEEIAKNNRSFIPAMYYWAKENFSILAQQTLVLAIFTGLNNSLGPIAKYITILDGALDKVLTNVFHEWTLSWFLKKHTQLPVLFSALEYHAARIERSDIETRSSDAHTPEYHALQLQRTWHVLMRQCEYAFAFMQYATTHKAWYSLAVLQAQELQETMKHELARTGKVLEARLNQFFAHETSTDAQSLLSIVQELHKNIYQDWHAFAELEKLEPY